MTSVKPSDGWNSSIIRRKNAQTIAESDIRLAGAQLGFHAHFTSSATEASSLTSFDSRRDELFTL